MPVWGHVEWHTAKRKGQKEKKIFKVSYFLEITSKFLNLKGLCGIFPAFIYLFTYAPISSYPSPPLVCRVGSYTSWCMCTHVHIRIFPTLPLRFETWSLIEPVSYQFSWASWPMSFRHLPVSISSPIPCPQCWHHRQSALGPAFYVGSGDLDSGPCFCVASTLQTEPSPQHLGSYSAKENITQNLPKGKDSFSCIQELRRWR